LSHFFRESNDTEFARKLPLDSVQLMRLVSQNDATVVNLGVGLSSEDAVMLEIITNGCKAMLIRRTEHNPPPVGDFSDIR